MLFVCTHKWISCSSQLKLDALQVMLTVENHFPPPPPPPPPLKPLKRDRILFGVCVPSRLQTRKEPEFPLRVRGPGMKHFYFFLKKIYEDPN